MKLYVSSLLRLAVTSALFLLGSATVPAAAQSQWDWWPDPTSNTGLSTWISYSDTYASLWSDRTLTDQEVGAIAQSGVQVVFLALSSPNVQLLSNRTDPFTADVQYAINSFSAQKILACASILSDDFTDSYDPQKYLLVDNLIAFNGSRGPADSGFTCVATDLEIPDAKYDPVTGEQISPSYLTSANFYLWKQFHRNMQSEITTKGGGLKLLAWMQGPDYLIAKMADFNDQQYLMTQEGITQDPDPNSILYDGALKFFTTQAGAQIFDAVIPMWYFKSADSYNRRLNHNMNELQTIKIPTLYLIAGFEVRNKNGLYCDACVTGPDDYCARLSTNDTVREQAIGLIGTGVFKWPIPSDWTCQ